MILNTIAMEARDKSDTSGLKHAALSVIWKKTLPGAVQYNISRLAHVLRSTRLSSDQSSDETVVEWPVHLATGLNRPLTLAKMWTHLRDF